MCVWTLLTTMGMQADWRRCLFSQFAMKYTTTPTFAINSLYNFGYWEMNPGPEWSQCWSVNE